MVSYAKNNRHSASSAPEASHPGFADGSVDSFATERVSGRAGGSTGDPADYSANFLTGDSADGLAGDLASADVIVVGAGFAGAVLAREAAERGGQKVVVLEQRPHIGGNAYDEYDAAGILVHRYGPHIFHTNNRRVFDYLSRFCDWRAYDHEVLADIHGIYTPVPFNFNSIERHFEPELATSIIQRLLQTFGADAKVPIIDLRNSSDALLLQLADFVYVNVFSYYTQKQWGLTPEQIDPSVTARVPIYTGRDNRYFTDTYQGMPRNGYTKLFEELLKHPRIRVHVGLDAQEVVRFDYGDVESSDASKDPRWREEPGRNASKGPCGGEGPTASDSAVEANDPGGSDALDRPFERILVLERPFSGKLIYTGPLDLLADKRFGLLPYRSLDFVYKTYEQKHVLPCGTVNYTVDKEYTRITEFTYLTGQELGRTTIMEEYPRAFEGAVGQIPYYAILNSENEAAYERYRGLFAKLDGFFTLGRLAEYRYYNMDQIVARALELADRLFSFGELRHGA